MGVIIILLSGINEDIDVNVFYKCKCFINVNCY